MKPAYERAKIRFEKSQKAFSIRMQILGLESTRKLTVRFSTSQAETFIEREPAHADIETLKVELRNLWFKILAQEQAKGNA